MTNPKRLAFPAKMTTRSHLMTKPDLQDALKQLRNNIYCTFEVNKVDSGYEVALVHPEDKDRKYLVMRAMNGNHAYLVTRDVNLFD